MLRVARLRGPDHCVVNVLGMLVPEGVIFYLFFFYFSWAVAGDRFAKWRPWIITLTHSLPTLRFFGHHPPTTVHHRAPPCSHNGATLLPRCSHGDTTISTLKTNPNGVKGLYG